MKKSGAQKSYSGTDELRWDRRFSAEVPVVINTMVGEQQGWIVDMSRRGLRLQGINVPVRSRIAIRYRGKFVEGSVRWSTPALGIGVTLDEPLQNGPLAAIWQRFHQNVAAFGGHVKLARPVFGRKA